MTMTFDQAVAIRTKSLMGHVDPEQLERALAVIRASMPATVRKPRKAWTRRAAEPGISNPWGLSAKMYRALEGVANGKSHKDIAEAEGVSPKTINAQIDKAKGKMGAATSAQAAVLWDRFKRAPATEEAT